ncbi:MAG TPA: hypothetical protein VKV39_06645 [Candidatus Sulfotelmatobacter sp.]|nr:hypothetical protein [Candidatus Sulfotelmatobacter sp.]
MPAYVLAGDLEAVELFYSTEPRYYDSWLSLSSDGGFGAKLSADDRRFLSSMGINGGAE